MVNPHNAQTIYGGETGILHLRRVAIAPWMKPSEGWRLGELERLEERARELRVNVSTWRRSFNAPRVGEEYRVTVHGDAGSVELRADGDLLATIAGALDDWETRYLFSGEELTQIQRQSVR